MAGAGGGGSNPNRRGKRNTPAANKPIAAKTAKIGQENGACAGRPWTSGGNEKNPSGNPRRLCPANGRSASKASAVARMKRLFTPPFYHKKGVARGDHSTADSLMAYR